MPLVAAALQKKMEATIKSALEKEHGKEADPESHAKTAKAVSQIAKDIVEAITTQAEVAPGIPLANGFGPGATTGPGKIT